MSQRKKSTKITTTTKPKKMKLNKHEARKKDVDRENADHARMATAQESDQH